MTDAPLTQHFTFTIDRVYDAPRERVFGAFANGDQRAQWFVGPGSWTPLIRELDFRRGGHERVRGQFDDGETGDFRATFHDIRENE
ncbi:MAG TPA: SRPBCC domain-containing protein, partial [Candidatus Aquilonibacter sp.]